MRSFLLLLSFSAALLLTSCMTMNSNHGSALGAGRGAVGVEASYLRSSSLPGQDHDSYRVGFLYGVAENFNLGVNAGRYAVSPASYYSAGARALWAVPNDNGSLGFGLDLDYYFAGSSGNGDADSLVGAGKYSLIQPSISIAYAFSKGDFKPFVGFKATPILITAYGGIDLQFGPLKPSLLLGASLPTLSPGSAGQVLLYTIEPALAFEF